MSAVIPLRKLNGKEIALLRFLGMHALRSAGIAAITLNRRDRDLATPLWRRGLINCWYRQAPDSAPSLQGPYFTLSHTGLRLAETFMHPREGGRS